MTARGTESRTKVLASDCFLVSRFCPRKALVTLSYNHCREFLFGFWEVALFPYNHLPLSSLAQVAFCFLQSNEPKAKGPFLS